MTGARVLACVGALSLASCYTIRYERNVTPASGEPRALWHNAWLGGAVPGGAVRQPDCICQAGFASVRTEVSPLAAVVQALTGGIVPVLAPLYEPSRVYVLCALPKEITWSCPPRQFKVMVLAPTTADPSLAPVAQWVEKVIAGEIRRCPGITVLERADVVMTLGAARADELLACADDACFAEVGQRFGAERVIRGTVQHAGSAIGLDLVAIGATDGQVVASAAASLAGVDDPGFFGRVTEVALGLVGEAPARLARSAPCGAP